MGIFGKKKMKVRQAPSVPEFDGVITPWECPPCKDTIAMEPGVEGRFRALWYNSLRGLKEGQWIWVEAIPGDVRLPDRFSDYIFADRQDMLLAYKYKGKIVGVSACCYNNVRALLESGYRVFCRAQKTGMFEGGSPRIEIYSSFRSDGFEEITLK